ncbi:MAG: TetR/AcrR family transcriptional regulator [Rhodobacterales bacterium]|nr:TetR/AcrR family transcriptional regulator [Rhodobacterales bacterium]
MVVKAAANLFDRNGYIETSLKDISAEAGLSKGGIYHYFSSKHEILFYIVDNYMNVLLGNVEEELKKISDPEAKIKYLMNRHLKHFNCQVPEGRALLNHARILPPSEFRYIVGKQKRYANILTDILCQMTGNDGEKRKLKAISYFIFGMYNSIMYWHDPKGPIPLKELSEICFNLFMDGWKSMSSSGIFKNT